VKKALVPIAALLAVALAPAAEAHPLGNFTVNRYAGIEVSGTQIYVHYALDLAEIPTFQEGATVRASGYARTVARRLDLRLDGRPVPLRPLMRRLLERPGAGGLKTLRFDAVYVADGSGTRLTFSDDNFRRRIGWREITVSARDGAGIVRASVPAVSSSDRLRRYPPELLRSPLEVTAASATFVLGDGPGEPPRITDATPPRHESGGFEALIEGGELSLGIVLVSLAIAAFWGAAHALTPGHGKALVAGYLIGTRGRPRDAVLLGATVTVTHTAGVFALGFVTLALSQFIVPESLYPWLTLVAGILVVCVGASVFWHRLGAHRRHIRGHDQHGHHHHHHHHDHDHHHEPRDDAITRRGIVAVGVAAGLLPCPSALVVLLSAIALHRVGFGLVLIIAFSLGLATTITGIGLLAVLARRAFGRLSLDGPVVRALPAASAFAILAVGVVLTAKAIPQVV
jgi:nickel/cobalt transporter (NicO) family protein